MRPASRIGGVAAAALCALLVIESAAPAVATAPSSQAVHGVSWQEEAPGVRVAHLTDTSLVDPPAPISIWLLRVDLALADVRAVLANDEIVDTETVPDIAARQRAIAAVNAGFFLIPAGDPAGIYKLKGQLVSDTRRPRGALGIVREGTATRLVFGRVSASMRLRLSRRGRPDAVVEIAGVDTTRRRGRLMLFTPAYHADTDTAANGMEWVLEGKPLQVASGPLTAGKTPIPRDGFVLSYGGTSAPSPLNGLRVGSRVELETEYVSPDGREEDWKKTEAIVGGAGLLLRDGIVVQDWRVEQFTAAFAETRHPRTLVGTHADGSLLLVTVDGRQPKLSAGMTLAELRALARGLGLRNALNLDGGGSTTMWAGGKVLNSPSDAAGVRKVSDALVIVKR